jgi:hypothetical protein
LLVLGCRGARPRRGDAPAPPALPERHSAPFVNAAAEDAGPWIDLTTLSVSLLTARVRLRKEVPALAAAPEECSERVVTEPGRFVVDYCDGQARAVITIDTRNPMPSGARRELIARDARTGRELCRHPLAVADVPIEASVFENRLLVLRGERSTTVVDLMQATSRSNPRRTKLPLGIAQTFDESVRWVGGYYWSSGDLLLSSDKRLARIEFQSTAPDYNGSIVWTRPPVRGSQGGAVLTGPVDKGPNVAPKHVVFYGYEPNGRTPVEIAIVEALASVAGRGFVQPPDAPCAHREVGAVSAGAGEVTILVACEEGAVVEELDVPSGRVRRRVSSLP